MSWRATDLAEDDARQQAADLNVTFNQYGQRDQADRRELSPPIEVESATWSAAGDLDYLVKERQEWWGRYGVQTDITCGSALLIYVRPKSTDSRESCSHSSFPFLKHTGAAATTVALTAFGSPPRSASLARIGGEKLLLSDRPGCSFDPFGGWRESNVTTVTAS
jgi:hypothetical protein